MVDCPPVATLNDLLNEALAGDPRERVIAHVQGCAACQGILGQLSSDPSWLPPTRPLSALSQAAEPTAHDASAPSHEFLARLKSQLASISSRGGAAAPSEASGTRGIPSLDG